MQNYLPVMIGLRYLRAKRSNAFISFVSLFAFLGMALGVFALIVVLSVMNGFDRELKERILRTVPHGFIEPVGGLSDPEALMGQLHGSVGVQGLAPFVKTNGLLTFAGNARGVEILGVDPLYEPAVSGVHNFMRQGNMSDLKAGEYNILMGGLLARFLGAGVGDTVTMTLPEVMITPAGVFPRSRAFTIAGIFDTGAQGDQTLVLMHLADSQKLLRLGNKSHGLKVKTDDIYSAPHVLNQLAQQVAHAKVTDWSTTQGHLFQAVKMEKTVVGFLLGIIIAVAAFNIVTSLVMMIAEKRSDIAVLRTMGLSSSNVVAIFMTQGLTLGVVGIAMGASFGILGALYIPDVVAWLEQLFGLRVFDPSVYFVTELPSQWRPYDSAMVCTGALLVSILASIYPAYRASQIAPAEALRYNI
ncbi:lipoprotein-releasing ABC transporter permease subunit [Marinagarivorans algicola]|uniref:lipoprotein-releasing ABC transporter permease subunit n=1 Tax=Marinagarivorans algicola TaxID=1513270 RepID=UPI0006B9C234|nr:lipoprotein-releasing ABC transporter permease subunit [Marinagarivorans algicola]